MTTRQRKALHLGGLLVFVGIAAFAFYRAPPDISRIKAGWLAAAAILAAIAVGLQGLQVKLFLRQEQVNLDTLWSIWFAAEKAWLNLILPAKIGTACSVVLLKTKLGVSWTNYLLFMLASAGAVAMASCVGMILLWSPSPVGAGLAIVTFMVLTGLLFWIYRMSWLQLCALGALALLGLAVLTAGVGACLAGLGYVTTLQNVAPVGVVLNSISVVAVTPGNFGFREAVLALLAPVLTLGFSVIIQGSTCYIFVRLLSSLVLATLLRGRSL